MFHSPFSISSAHGGASDGRENGGRPLNALWAAKKFSVQLHEAEVNEVGREGVRADFSKIARRQHPKRLPSIPKQG
jgi:hypothetical protein